MMTAVQIGIVPITAYTFCRTNPISILINVPIVILASVLVPICIALLMMQLVFGMMPPIGISLADLVADTVIRVNHMLSFDGGFSMSVAGISTMAVICFYLLAFGASSEWVRVKLIRKESKSIARAALLILLPIAMLSSCLFDRLSDDEILFPYVGQGDCTHIRAEGHDILIDGGGSEMYNVGEKTLMPYLLKSGADSLDMALVTHLHTDHFKGICELAEVYPVANIGIPSDYRGADTDIEKDKIIYIKPDSKVTVSDDVYVSVLWPIKESPISLSADDENEHNMVYLVNYKGVKVMVTGDLLEEDELEMLDYYRHDHKLDDLKCDVL
jgi:competence protein ComEC